VSASTSRIELDLKPLALSELQEAELRRLLSYYKRETERCREAKAFLAGCVMAGAELEAALVLMMSGFPDDVLAAGSFPKRKQGIKPLLEWNLAELLRAAKATGWLPSALEYGKDEWSSKKAKVGDYAEVVRDMRNLLHPARYMEDHYKKRITNKHLELALETIEAVAGWFYSRCAKSLLERLKEEEA
jgi:hypothetical protein